MSEIIKVNGIEFDTEGMSDEIIENLKKSEVNANNLISEKDRLASELDLSKKGNGKKENEKGGFDSKFDPAEFKKDLLESNAKIIAEQFSNFGKANDYKSQAIMKKNEILSELKSKIGEQAFNKFGKDTAEIIFTNSIKKNVTLDKFTVNQLSLSLMEAGLKSKDQDQKEFGLKMAESAAGKEVDFNDLFTVEDTEKKVNKVIDDKDKEKNPGETDNKSNGGGSGRNEEITQLNEKSTDTERAEKLLSGLLD